jgi:hypothetical protein
VSNGSTQRTMPVQTISESKKQKDVWLEAMSDFLYLEASQQRKRNGVFSEIKKMVEGDFVYRSVDIEKTLNPEMMGDFRTLTADTALPTHLKHFDFLGIIANAIKGVFSETDSKYRVESFDEYYTNDFIRAKTERLNQYAQKVFKLEIDRMLIGRGFNPNQTEFQSEEEQQQYLQQLEAEVQKLTPAEIEKDLSKNFKVMATEWANNVLTSDKEKFSLEQRDGERLVDYILTGRWFRHYRVGYDYYDVEDWEVEEVFFSEYADTKYPQDCEFIGRLTEMSISNALMKYGHIMTPKQQKDLGDFWGQGEDYKTGITPLSGGTGIGEPFAENLIMPFHNYLDHNVNLQMEAALGAPLAQTKMENGDVVRHWMPRAGNMFGNVTKGFSQQLRSDILVSNATVEVMEAYWTSFEKFGVLIYENEVGQLDVETTSEELLNDFIKENEIKTKTNISLKGLQDALNAGNLSDYKNTITWHWKPQSRYIVVIKSNNSLTINKDLILGGDPIIQQIKGDSNIYQVKHPVGGLITNSVIKKAFPYQQLHNICLNQVSELLADELGVFFSIDINTLPAEYKDQTTEEALNSINSTIRNTKILPTDPSRSNTQGSSVYPNLFQRNEVVFATQVQYRQQMAEYFMNKGFQQVGVTSQMLGTPTTYETKEGVQQQASASYALMSNIIDEFNTSKAKSNELHIAIAQQCEVNGKSSTRLVKNSDGANNFIDILAEDPEYFPLRKLSVLPVGTSSDRAVVKGLQNMLMSDNTIQKDFSDLVDIFTNPYALRLRQIAEQMRKRSDANIQQERQFQEGQLDKQIQSNKQQMAEERKHEVVLTNLKGEWQLKGDYLVALGRDSASTTTDDFDQITKAYQTSLKEKSLDADIDFKGKEMTRKMAMDADTRKLEAEKLKLKAQEIQVRREGIAAKKFSDVVNKN